MEKSNNYEWQPIETAPKDTVIIGFDGKEVHCYQWVSSADERDHLDEDLNVIEGHLEHRWCFPVFHRGGTLYGENNYTENPPILWMPFPHPPVLNTTMQI